ncbi:MAG TPA: PAS domain S-box protein, partial [Pyrinomonadaceae bacterium]|nr:PAS domain S-box protein [Pyrinomonadaceae bacterium]
MLQTDPDKQSPAEDRYLAILEQSPVSVQILSADGYTIRVNKAWEKLWGVTLEQIGDYNILEDEQLVEKGIMPYIKRAFEGEATDIPPILYDPENSIPGLTANEEPQRWTKGIIYPIKDASGKVQEVVLLNEDISERMQAEARFKASEARYRMLFETTLDAIMIVDDQGKYIDVNESLCRILKNTRENLIGSHFSEFILPERLEDSRKAFEELGKTGVFTGDFPLRASDGSIAELEWSSRANFLPGLHVCVARDVTERKQTEEARRVSEERYQRAAESGRVGIWDLNLQTNELYLAPNLKEMLGYRDDELRNDLVEWRELIHPEDKERAIEATNNHLEGNSPRYQIEVRRRHKNGHYLHFLVQGVTIKDEFGKPIRLTGSDTDITERKKTEERLRQSEERNRTLLENANDIIYSHDLQGNYLSINRAGELATGYTREQILNGLNLSQVIAPEHLEKTK